MRVKPRKKITVDLVGGLGNQLFGLGFGASVSNRLQCDLTLDHSFISFGSNNSRVLELRNFDFSTFNINYRQTFLTKFSYLTKNSFIKRLIVAFILKTKKSVNENQITENYQYTTESKYSGYFQDWKFVDSLLVDGVEFKIELSTIRNELNFYIEELIQYNPILIHIRLGDYLKYSNIYEILPEKYYLSALREMNKIPGDSPVWLLAEDAEQVKDAYPNLFNSATKIIDKFADIEDFECFYLMTKANNLVASNSTFSLWASWFASNQDANVIVPSEFKVSGKASQIIDRRWDAIDLKTFKLLPKSDLDSIRKENYLRFNRHFLEL